MVAQTGLCLWKNFAGVETKGGDWELTQLHADLEPLHGTNHRTEAPGEAVQARSAVPASTAHHCTGRKSGARRTPGVVETFGGLPLISFTFYRDLVKLG